MQKTGLESLETRRLYQDLILMYKIIFGYTHLTTSKFFKLSSVTITGGRSFKLEKNRSRLDICRNWFASRRINIWNQLPPETDFSSLIGFELSLKRIDLKSYLWLNYSNHFKITEMFLSQPAPIFNIVRDNIILLILLILCSIFKLIF